VRALGDLALTEQDGVAVHIGFRCEGHASSITIAVDFIAALSHGHRHLATIGTAATVLYRGHSRFVAAIDAASHARHGVGPLFWLGIEHILTGYDHLVFLLGLMLVGGRLRSLLVVITAFTLAHSITLGAAAFRLWTPSAAMIEPAIALSIAYIGIENWFVTDAARRWMITFPFGLVHGFGFAGALEDVGLSADQIPMALAAFNAGVEMGQLAVVGVALPAILWVRSRHRLGLAVVRVTSVAITVAGVWWFTVRVI
jgi:HupE / UreJ protein